jgi:hypothetical protein
MRCRNQKSEIQSQNRHNILLPLLVAIVFTPALSFAESKPVSQWNISGSTRDEAEIAVRNKRIDNIIKLGVNEIIFVERGPGLDLQPDGSARPGHYYANFGYAAINPNFWFHSADGSRLCKLSIKTGTQTVLLHDPKGSIRDPQVHYDAEKILFSYRKGGSHHYNLYEMDMNGSNLRQITSGKWDDIEATYLPDGGIAFCSSRCKRYIGCWIAPSAIMFRCDHDGRNIRMLSSGADAENTPAVLPDGRILYTRWEYVNRDPVVFHHLWTMNPDGSGQQIFFGNMHPGGVFIDAEAIPGTDKIVLINSPGHGRPEHAGHLSVLADKQGPDSQASMKALSQDSNFRDPYPLSEDLFLAAHGNQLMIVEADGQSEVLHRSGMMLHEPYAVRKRPRERIISQRIDLSSDSATLILNDVYEGRNMGGIKRGSIKKLLIMEDLPKPANYHGGGSQPIGHGVTSTLKRILGTVPVGKDGSASFIVPPLRSIYFAALDENDLSIKQMRSFVTLQPGETMNCLGCHEERTKTPVSSDTLQALHHKPSVIEPIQGVPDILDFPRDIQPILDKHCIKCHTHDKRDGGLALEGDRGPVFSHSYYSLILHWQVKDTAGNPINGSGRQNGNDPPYTTYSSAAPLMQKIDGRHYDVKLSKLESKIIRLWLDTNNQYAGTYAAFGTGQVGGCWGYNKPIRVMANEWPSTPPAEDAIKRRCLPCHGRMFPQNITDSAMPMDHGDMLSWTRPMSRFSRHHIFNLSRPEKSLALLTPLSHEAGGYAEGEPMKAAIKENRDKPPQPIVHPVIFKDTTDPDYRKILAHIDEGRDKLNEIKRFDMPGFKPNPVYVHEMKRFGILSKSFDLDRDKIDVYQTDQKYWKSMWHEPE